MAASALRFVMKNGRCISTAPSFYTCRSLLLGPLPPYSFVLSSYTRTSEPLPIMKLQAGGSRKTRVTAAAAATDLGEKSELGQQEETRTIACTM